MQSIQAEKYTSYKKPLFQEGFSFFMKKAITAVRTRVEKTCKGTTPNPKRKHSEFESLVPTQKTTMFREGFMVNSLQSPVNNNNRETQQHVPIPEKLHPSGFREFVNERSGKFGKIDIQSLSEAEILPQVNITKLIPTSKQIRKVDLSIPYKTTYFGRDGKGVTTLAKGTRVNFDNTKPILSLYDARTGKYQAYAMIQSTTNSRDTSGNTLENTGGGYIRTAWLDGVIQRPQSDNNREVLKEKPPKTISFSGYLGPDGKEIPAYILKAVTVNYFGKNIVPKVAAHIQQTDQKIGMIREIMKQQYLIKKIPLKETPAYKIQLKQIQEKGKMEALQMSLTEFTINNGNIYDTDTLKVVQSIQNSADWEIIKQKAAYIYRQKRSGKI